MIRLALAAALALAGLPAGAHDGETHAAAPVPAPDALPFPIRLGGPFTLTDQHGATRTQADPAGRLQLLFFGYANCQSICSAALPVMADAVDLLAARGVDAVPVMVTVDPDRDTPDAMADALAQLHPAFVGLTGDAGTLAAVYRQFAVESEVVFEDPELGPVYAHGSQIFLLDGDGGFLTLLPPILSADRIADIAAARL